MSNNVPRSEHDPAADTTEPLGSSDKAFGLVFAAVFTVIGLYPLVRGDSARPWVLALAALFLVVAFARPGLLAPLNKLWTRFGLILHRVVSPVALFAIFCLAVLPTGLVLRALGKDPLRLRLDPESKTYWIERKPPGRSDEQMKKQF